jgi:hypothetical protein
VQGLTFDTVISRLPAEYPVILLVVKTAGIPIFLEGVVILAIKGLDATL